MVIFLFVVTRLEINIGIIIGMFLLFVAAKNYSFKINEIIKSLARYEKTYFILMGVVHGLTNLGGSLLAASYATFAIFQIMTLIVSGYNINIGLSGVGIYLIVGISIFIVTEKLVYMDINNANYSKNFAAFLLLSGMLLCAKSIWLF